MKIQKNMELFRVAFCDMTLVEYVEVVAWTFEGAAEMVKLSGHKNILDVYSAKMNAHGVVIDWRKV
jgi:hypothetical protein